jgi:hypothetical protein
MRSSSPIQHHDLPFEQYLFIFVSSLKITLFSFINGPVLIPLSKPPHARTCLQLKNDFLCCTYAPNPTSLKACLTVMSNNNLQISNRSCFVVADVVPSRPSITRVTQCLFSRSARRFGCPPHCLAISPSTSFLKFAS